VGCVRHTITKWLKDYSAIGEENGYTPEQIEEYGLHLKHIAAVLELKEFASA
jgi:hypothetical protein